MGNDPKIEHGIFGKTDANEFASDAAVLREVNEVYAEAHLDEQELGRWPTDGTLPPSFQ